jgi:bifunctional UDP-N-acetylglucosamine pyrophosphorylase/glucosamine-1-phosphate N-acetyltransferase
MNVNAIILAAGKGSRMKSAYSKVLHKIAGKPILQYVVDAAQSASASNCYVIVGHQKELVQERITGENIQYVAQEDQLGTGHAVMQVADIIDQESESLTVVLAGDCPLIEAETVENLLASHKENNSKCTILTAKLEDPARYGRILRGKMGSVLGIREAKDCSSDELNVNEINTGVYVFDTKALFEALKEITNNNAQNEYYLTDVVHILKHKGYAISAYVTQKVDQILGVNTRMDLAKIHEIIFERNNQHFMEEGVTIVDPGTTFIDSTVTIGTDTVIRPFTIIQGDTVIGEHSEVGPHAAIRNQNLPKDSVIKPFENLW